MRPWIKHWRSKANKIVVYLNDGMGVCPSFTLSIQQANLSIQQTNVNLINSNYKYRILNKISFDTVHGIHKRSGYKGTIKRTPNTTPRMSA